MFFYYNKEAGTHYPVLTWVGLRCLRTASANKSAKAENLKKIIIIAK